MAQLAKVDIINAAYSHLGISGLTKTPSAEDVQLGLERLEDMAHRWNKRFNDGYNFEDDPWPNTAIGIDRAHKLAYETNLAVSLEGDFEVPAPPSVKRMAAAGLSQMSAELFTPGQNTYPSRAAIGSGNLWGTWWRQYYPGVIKLPDSANKTVQDKDAKRAYVFSWSTFLNGADISTSTFFIEEGDSNIVISNEANSTDQTSFEISFLANTPAGRSYQITNRVVSSAGLSEDMSLFLVTR
jgi:hypothetical protein